jgi:hypothetical protein
MKQRALIVCTGKLDALAAEGRQQAFRHLRERRGLQFRDEAVTGQSLRD